MRAPATIGLIALVLALLVGIGYYTTADRSSDRPVAGVDTECYSRFSNLDTMDDDRLDYGEFQAYREGVSDTDFSVADTDADRSLTPQEFCAWTGNEMGTG